MARILGLPAPAAWTIGAIAGPVGLYVLFLALSVSPFFQRHFLYAHRVHTLWWNDVNVPEKWGFAKNQVTPFKLTTADGTSIYAWHILPLPLYATHETKLIEQPSGLAADFSQTESFRILKDDPDARVVIYFHGNAGHIVQNIRGPSFHALTDTSTYHVLTIDYRGFGHSGGDPTEQGLIEDASAAVDFVINLLGVAPSRIVLLGQSLGTAVTSGVAEKYAAKGIDFAGVILVAGFSSLPTMLSGYAIGGLVPVLRPFSLFPPTVLEGFLDRIVVDKWLSAARLETMVREVKSRAGRLRLSLVAARNDRDIPSRESDRLFAAAVNGTLPESQGLSAESLQVEKTKRTLHKGTDAFVSEWKDGDVVIRQELFPFGGHNDIMMFAPTTLAVMRSFDLITAE